MDDKVTIDLDDRPQPRRTRWATGAAALAVFALGVAIGVTATRHAADPPQEPLLVLAGDGTTTTTVYFADGTRQEAYLAVEGPWRPPKPVRMVTVAAVGTCSITVNEHLVVIESPGPNRLAVCVWVAPS